MNQFIPPALYCPFPSHINKHAEVLEQYAIEWLVRFNLLADESVYQRFSKSKFFLLVAGVYPNCQLEELKIANDWVSWLFIWDDQCDMSDIGKQPELLKVIHNRFLQILNGADANTKDIPLAHALSDLRQRMLQRASYKWFHHFVHAVEDYFNGCIREATNRAQGIAPDLETYIRIRQSAGAMYSAIELIEFCNQLMLPELVREHTIVKNLKRITNNIVCWCNDIFSVGREMGSGDVHNLVLVLHYQQQLPLEQAIKCAAELHDNQVRWLMNLEACIPFFGEEVDAELRKYISGMHSWISGNLDWYSHSARYRSAEMLAMGKEKFDCRASAKSNSTKILTSNVFSK